MLTSSGGEFIHTKNEQDFFFFILPIRMKPSHVFYLFVVEEDENTKLRF